MAPPKEYTQRDIDVAERLTRVETTLVEVAKDLGAISGNLSEHKEQSTKSAAALEKAILGLVQRIDDSKFKWSSLVPSLVTRENAKLIAYVLAGLTGTSALVKAIWP